MRDIGALLGRATAHGARYDQYTGGGKAGESAAEIGRMLAGLPEGPHRVLLLRYMAGGPRDRVALVDALVTDMGTGQQQWERRAAWMQICRVSVAEFLAARRCPECDGNRTRVIAGACERCPVCQGTGYEQASKRARSEALGIPRKTYDGGPAERAYHGRIMRLVGWEDEGIREVARRARRA